MSAERGARNVERWTLGEACCRLQLRARRSALRVVAALGGMLLLATPLAAQEPDRAQLIDVQVGFNGAYKLGCWTPVELTFRSGPQVQVGQASLVVPDADGVPVAYSSPPIQMTPGRTTAVTVYVRFGRADQDARAQFVAADGKSLDLPLEMSPPNGRIGIPYPVGDDERLVVCLGRMPTLAEAAAEFDAGRGRGLVVVQLNDLRRAPTRWQGYESADAVVLAPDRLETFTTTGADAAQVAALLQWVKLGGRLGTTITLAAQPLFAAGGALQEFAGGEVGASTPLPRTTELEKFAGPDVKQSIAPAALRKSPLEVPRLATTDAVVVAREGDLPLVVRRAVGHGVSVAMSFSPEHPLLAGWNGRKAVVRQLLVQLGVLTEEEIKPRTDGTSMPYYGYYDLAGQLRSALDQYEGVQVISFFTLAVMVLAYLTLIGPVDYVLVRRVLKRPELTWITFPTFVVLTSIGAYYLAVYLKGDQLRVSQADVVDCDAQTGAIRGTSWAGVFSPVGRSYDVAFAPTNAAVKVEAVEEFTGWLGLSGAGLGGMHAGGGPSWFTQPYLSVDGGAELQGAPIQVWSSKTFVGRSAARTSQSLHAPLKVGNDRRLTGTLRNPFPFACDDALLFWRSRAFDLGDLPVGGTSDLARLDVRDLQAVLQDWKVILSANKNPVHIGQPHDPGSQDVEEILRKMMFHQSAGGDDHTQLGNRQFAFLDMSPLLSLHRAVLVARVDPEKLGKLELTAGGGAPPGRVDRRSAFIRLVIPVEENN